MKKKNYIEDQVVLNKEILFIKKQFKSCQSTGSGILIFDMSGTSHLKEFIIGICSIKGERERERGKGIIVKINNNDEREEYKICGKECLCYVDVECENDDDCGINGDECVEYKCRGGEEGERRFAQVAMMVPMSVCIFGVFTSMFLAKEYGVEYFSGKCNEECSLLSVGDTSASTDISEEMLKHMKDTLLIEREIKQTFKRYKCRANCFLEKEVFLDGLHQIYEYQEKHTDYQGRESNPIIINELMDYNGKKHSELCESVTIENNDLIATDLVAAMKMFLTESLLRCEDVEYLWENEIALSDGTILHALQYDYGILENGCKVLASTLFCELRDGIPSDITEPKR